MRKFPIGIQSFVKMREDGYIYIDKTPFVKHLHEDGCFYFLSRPRRFGKSLFLDTLRQAFLGRRELFKGLFLYDNWDWSKQYPVIYISFGSGVVKSCEELQQRERELIDEHCSRSGISLSAVTVSGRFRQLILQLNQKFQQRIVVLIDEYDKPILDNITDYDTATAIREELKNFYSVLKDSDEYLELVFITGVSKFSKVSIFSGLNNLKDLTINKKYSTICGYTQEELENSFQPELVNVDMERLKRWYNGYSWGNGSVYNPFDILQFLDDKEYKNYWFESGTPSFLIKLLLNNHYYLPQLNDLEISETLAGSFEIENIDIETLLFQTGYLTIKSRNEVMEGFFTYRLGFPNREVQTSLSDYLLYYIFASGSAKESKRLALSRILQNNDLDGMRNLFTAFFAAIPHDWYRKNSIAEYEGFYASVFYSYFSALGLDVRVEDATNQGQLDMAVLFQDCCYIFEFKVIDKSSTENSALSQIKEKDYAKKFRADYPHIYLIGVEFSKDDRNIASCGWEEVQ